MNTTQTTHPSYENLAAFNSGRLGVLESAEVERHLADCEACCRLLTTIPNDTLISLLGPQSDTKAEATPSLPPQQPNEPRPVLEATIIGGEFKTQSEGKPSTTLSTEVPAELQGHPRYRIQALLGRGGMGSVFRAEHRVMNRPVALKVIDRHLVQTPGLVERFHREVQAAAKLSHPNIVTAYDAEQAGDLHFLVMEIVEGHDLAEVVRQRGRLPVQEACEYVRQAALGLQHASERGMVHRDIKPQNLMLTASPDASAPGVIKILDFGLAQFATEIAETSGLTQVGAMMGTPDYMAPEQARDAHSADIRADIYSLGCTLYCLLSGGAPFPQGSIVEKIMAHVERQPKPLQELRNDVPPKLAAVLAKMMAKAPGDRYQTPAEVAEALLPFASSDATKIAAEVVPPIPIAAVRQPRSPLFIATAVLGVLATLVLLGVIVIVTDQGRIEVRSEVDDVDLIVKRGGEQIDIFDAQTGSKMQWFFSGEYKLELKGNRNDIAIHNGGFTLTRWGKQIVTLKRKPIVPAGDKSPDLGESLALAFNGKDSYVAVPSLKYGGDHPLTIEAWTVLERLVGELTGEVLLGNPELGGVGLSATNDLNLSGRQWSFGVSLKDRAGYVHAFEKQKLPRNQLLHLAGVYDGKSEVRFYVNGQLQSRAPAAGDHKPSSLPFALGANPNANDRFADHFLGRMHEIHISKVARYDQDFTPDKRFTADKNTLALYHFDEGSGDVLKDSSGNGHDGKIVGAKWIELGRSPEPPQAKAGWHGWPKDAPPPAIAPFDGEQAKQHQEAWAKYLGVRAEYTNSIGMKFRLIPPGEFLMGSTPENVDLVRKLLKQYWPDEAPKWEEFLQGELPQHKVILTKPIYLGVHEVTQAQYAKVMGENPSHFSATGGGKEAVAGMETSSFPAEMVSWHDAVDFCAKLSQLEKLNTPASGSGAAKPAYRLPTEAEWEFSCRAGTTTRFGFGDQFQNLEKAGWAGTNRTHAVGELTPNPFALYDMHGNVGEWAQDLWEPNYYAEFKDKPALDPACLTSADLRRVVRGGFFHSTWIPCQASSRAAGDSFGRINHAGMRVALSVDAVRQATEKPEVENATEASQGLPKDSPAPAIAPYDSKQAKLHQKAWAQHLGVPVEHTNSIGIKFVLIPPGEFMIGSTPEEIAEALKIVGDADDQNSQYARACAKSEGPRHKVILTQPRYLGVHEVTQSQYKKVMSKNPSHFATTGQGQEAVVGLDTANHPVESVSWHEAVAFCAKLSQQESLPADDPQLSDAKTRLSGYGYRLPTEAEWEFSHRAGTTTKYLSGEGDEQLDQTAWIGRNSDLRTHAVGELLANPFGLHDLQGNVWEWCHDQWELTYYNSFLEQPARDPSGPLPPSDDQGHLLRGGGWNGQPYQCRASFHHHMVSQYRDSSLGFRVSLSVEAVKMANMKPAVKGGVVPAGEK
ncbi:MAG: SUMF1/EgtB/PvdO family nonheme iron enzyme [Pirellulaceae bacterium]